MSDFKINLVDNEELSISEKEQKVLENAGVEVADDNTYKLDLTKQPEENAVQEQSADEGVFRAEQSQVELQEVGEENKEPQVTSEESQEEQLIELIEENNESQESLQKEEDNGESQKQVLQEEVVEQLQLPENLQKLVQFMEETGGTLEDYVRLNTDYSNVDDSALLKEYYKQTKSHLDNDEIDFLIEDNFAFDEDLDDERDIRRKKLAHKEEINKARKFLGDLKNKYYDEIRSTSKLNPDQQKALEFFNQYKKEQEELAVRQQKQSEHFIKQTDNVFSDEFKGFDFKVGESKYRFKVSDVQQTKQAQSDIMEVFGKFLDQNNMLADASGYHKALFAARNADKIASHFYEQGKADAIKKLQAESKNINMDPRKTSNGTIEVGGTKMRVINGDDSSKLRVKIRK